VVVAETCHRTVYFSSQSIAEFARLTGDANPLHHDTEAAHRARHGRIIASGQQTTSQMIGLAATHFSRRCEQMARELLCLNFNFSLKAPVFADEAVELQWKVASAAWHSHLEGWLAQVDGWAHSTGRLCVVARGTLLIKAQAAAA
jgi:acyl dehydratase